MTELNNLPFAFDAFLEALKGASSEKERQVWIEKMAQAMEAESHSVTPATPAEPIPSQHSEETVPAADSASGEIASEQAGPAGGTPVLEEKDKETAPAVLEGTSDDASPVVSSHLGQANSSAAELQEVSSEQASAKVDSAGELSPTLANAQSAERPKSQPASSPEPKAVEIVLPNAVAGTMYFALIEALAGKSEVKAEEGRDTPVLSDIGLSLVSVEDGQGFALEGTPTQAGTFTYLISSSGASKEVIKLLVNPDPRSLWKEKDPSPEEPYPKDHFACQFLNIGNERIVAGSLRGRSHAHAGTFRDDDFLLHELHKGGYCLAVADGAGSAPYSREGSRLACEALRETVDGPELAECMTRLREILGPLDEDGLRDALSGEEKQKQLTELMYEMHTTLVKAAIERIEQEVRRLEGSEIRDFATTLLYTVLIPAKSTRVTSKGKRITESGHVALAYGIGDGVIGHVKGDKVKLLNTPDGGEFSGQTRFLTMSDTLQTVGSRMKIAHLPELEGLYLMTDGVSDPRFETDSMMEKIDPWYDLQRDLMQQAQHESDEALSDWMKEWLSFWSQGNHDDRTILFAHGSNIQMNPS